MPRDNQQQKSSASHRHLIHQVIDTGKVTRQDYMQLTTLFLSEQRISEDDRQQINRIFEQIQAHQIRITD